MVSPSIPLALRASESTMPLLAMLFFIVPVIEMVVLIEVGSAIGSLPTIALVSLTAVLGVALLRQ
ncbi:MAG: FxsA family protein, partial [Pseudomonadales bacterium]